jgi:hypothetical protein
MGFLQRLLVYVAYLEPRNAGVIAGLPGNEISDIVLENVSIKAPEGMTIQDARAIKLNNVKIKAQKGPPFILKNAAVKKSGINWFFNKLGNK